MNSTGKSLKRQNTKAEIQMATDGEAEHASDHMFAKLKGKNERVPVHVLFNAIQKVGIRVSDPRLHEMVEQIEKLQKNVIDNQEDAKSAYFLNKETFKEVIRQNVVMLHRCLENDFMVSDLSNLTDTIDKIYYNCKENTNGAVASYIPQLARFDPNLWGVSLCTVEGQRHSIGDTDMPFCLQSSSKPLTYALAQTELGSAGFHKFVGYEPSGVSFNEIVLNGNKKPHNPLINAGAIITASLVQQSKNLADRFDYVVQQYKKLAGGEFVGFSNSTFLSERETADRNYALSYHMKEYDCFPEGKRMMEACDLYFQLCSIEITAESGAVIAATLANGGICPLTGERVFSAESVRDTLSLMKSCGMYDYSGQFAFKVGLPAKSGVSGTILIVVPNQLGICTWSPPLDKQGNSCRGVQFCSELVANFGFHNFHGMVHATANVGAAAAKRHAETEVDKEQTMRDIRSNMENKQQEVVCLLFASYDGDLTALRRMYLRGINMAQADYDGRTALHVAAAEGRLSVVEMLLETIGVPHDPKDRWDHTPLSEAQQFKKDAVVKYIEAYQNKKPQTPAAPVVSAPPVAVN